MFFSAFSAQVDEVRLDPAAHMVVGRAGETDPAGLRDTLQPRGDIDAIAQNILAVDQNVAEIDADAIEDALCLGNARVALDHLLLNGDRAFDRSDHGRKLQQHAVTHRLDEPPAEVPHDRRRSLAMLAHRARRAGLVLAHEAGIADDVGGQDRGEFALRVPVARHFGGPALRRRHYAA